MFIKEIFRPVFLTACVLVQKVKVSSPVTNDERKERNPCCGGKSNCNSAMEATTPTRTKPIVKDGRFENPWPTFKRQPNSSVLHFMFLDKDRSNVPSEKELDETLPIVQPDFSQFDCSLTEGVRLVWLGHASVLVQFDGVTVLTDPIFSQRCSPFSYVGPKRYRNPPCDIGQLPQLDAVVISHNHYDHLDHKTVVKLNTKYGNKLTWFVPMSLASWLKDCGCESVFELSWWDSQKLPGNDKIEFVSTPCQHWCNRGLMDSNKVLWCSWSVIGPKHRFFFGGDTGYCSGFEEIGREFGPFDLAAIPIGAYEPRWFMKPIHVNPEESVQIHHDIKSKASLGIHWGTFKLTYEPYLEPRERLREIVTEKKMAANSFFTLKHGEIHAVGTDNYSEMD